MKVLSHRGYWKTQAEKNQSIAFERSFSLGFGTETDVRDCAGELLISHDMPSGAEMKLATFLGMLGNRHLPLAVNIKADGMARLLKDQLDGAGVRDWFVFDMSVPDTRSYLASGASVFVRMSEVEREAPWLDRAAGVWLDAFDTIWYDPALIEGLVRSGKRVCIVSPELHGRDPAPLWEQIHRLRGQEEVLLCTDLPEQARTFFGARE